MRAKRELVGRLAIFAALLCSDARALGQDMAVYGQVGEGTARTRGLATGWFGSLRGKDATAVSPWDVFGEFEVGEWYVQAQAESERRFFTQVGATPVLRYTVDGDKRNIFVEAGVGLNWIAPHAHYGNHHFSTTFNFGDHLGLGTRFGDAARHEVALRAQHFSNAGIKNPNPGINFLQLRYSYHF